MYKCGKCEIRYDLSDKHHEYIGTECQKNGIATTIVFCPECEAIHIVGGESDWDTVDGREIIMMFGHDVKQHNYPELENGIMAFRGVKEE